MSAVVMLLFDLVEGAWGYHSSTFAPGNISSRVSSGFLKPMGPHDDPTISTVHPSGTSPSIIFRVAPRPIAWFKSPAIRDIRISSHSIGLSVACIGLLLVPYTMAIMELMGA